MDLDRVELNDWLLNFSNFERKPDKNMLNLSTMSKLCEYFGHPEKACPCFHVAGSKGKGTISANIAGILSASGYKVGIYASPHVLHFVERVRSATGPFSESVYQSAEEKLKTGINDIINKKIVSKEMLTWFELVTVFAMLCFKEAKVDYAVYEVGMGGRLDATNIINPICIAMGPIELEHTEYLGDTLAKIAKEKVGVFKSGVPIISAPQAEDVVQTFDDIAKRNSTIVTYVPNNDYQSVDADIARIAIKKVIKQINDTTIETGLKSVSLPARYETINHIKGYSLPFLLLDGAHTVNSVKAILGRLQKDKIRGNLLFGCAADKDVKKMAKMIIKSNIFNNIYLTIPGDFKKSNLQSITKAFGSTKNIRVSNPNYKQTIKIALKESSSENTPLIVLGSFYLAGEVKKIIQQKTAF